MNSPWPMVGDFNLVLFDYELMGATNGHRCCFAFCECIEYCHLMDVGFQGSPFTWRRLNLRERLDHVLVNQHWYNEFVEIGVVHLPMFNSDNCPLWFQSSNSLFHSFGSKPFKFISTWLGHTSFNELVQCNWRRSDNWSDNINAFVVAAKVWNKEVFGNIQRRKDKLIRHLHGIQWVLSSNLNPFLDNLRKKLWWEYDVTLFEEEVLWAQKSRCRWLLQGD